MQYVFSAHDLQGRNDGHLLNKLLRRRFKALTNLFPKVQAVRVEVDIFIFRRMKLHNAFILAPEDILDPAHLFLCWAAVAQAHTDVFPASCPRCNNGHFSRLFVLFTGKIASHAIKPKIHDFDSFVALDFGYLSHG